METKHITVLKDEAVTALALMPTSVVVDATFGGGGHSAAILHELGESGKLLAFDADETAFKNAPLEVKTDERVRFIAQNFRQLTDALAAEGVGEVDAILADLGWRTDQFTDGGKGFSFNANEPLLMTFGNPEHHDFTAYDIVNEWAEESIADIIYGYGEERGARLIAKAILKARAAGEIATAAQLADIIEATVGHFYRRSRLHPATKTFQALRIAVNDELGALKELLHNGFRLLAPHGRLAIITFHSLEDRLVKQTFKEFVHDQTGQLVSKKPVVPTEAECRANPRARSAKLRTIEKL